MLRNGWEPSMRLCSGWATRLSKWIFRTTQRFCWTPRIGLWRMWIKRVKGQPCHSIRPWIVTMPRWPRDWNILRIFWRICLTTTNNKQTHKRKPQTKWVTQQLHPLVRADEDYNHSWVVLFQGQNRWMGLDLFNQQTIQRGRTYQLGQEGSFRTNRIEINIIILY